MIELRDAETGATLGSVSQEQLDLLIDILEEESDDDQDYYIDGPTVDLLEQEGADAALVKLLRQALGDRDGMDIRWSRS